MNNENEHEHTPGPWEAVGSAVKIPNPAGRTSGWIESIGHCESSMEERRANARLIAAAPDLLAALRGCLATMNAHEPGRALTAALNAIAKATGAESERSNGCKLSDDHRP